MGTLYYTVCHDCAEVLCIGKFWNWRIVKYDTLANELEQEILKETEQLFAYFDCDDVGNVGDRAGAYKDEWIKHVVYILAFLSIHNGHRIAIVDEHSDLHRITRIEKVAIEKEPDAEICVCGHHFRAHISIDYRMGEDNAPRVGRCSLCECNQFVSEKGG